MATLKREIKEILDKYGIDPTDKSKLWDCHGTLVLYHKAYEIIAAKENIIFEAPQIIEAHSHDRIVCICVSGRMGDRVEWSFGEAAPGNCTNKYPYAMAEKRAKDRVIAKLVGLAQYVYSEDEADDFKNPLKGSPVADGNKRSGNKAVDKAVNDALKDLQACVTLDDLKTVFQARYKFLQDSNASTDQLDILTDQKDNCKQALEAKQ